MQPPKALANCRHIDSPTVGCSKRGAPPRQAPGVSPTPSGSASTAGNCRAQGGAHPACGQPGLTPCRAACWAATHHSLRARWALKPDRHPAGHAAPPQPQGLLGPSAEQTRAPSEVPPVPQQRAHARHPTTGIPTGQQQTTRHNTHTSNSHGRIGSRPTFLCLVAWPGNPCYASHLQQQPAGQGRAGQQQGRAGRG